MNTVRKIVWNSGASLLTQVSTPASSFVLVFIIARRLGVSGVGAYSSAFSLLYMFEAFTCLGFQYLITKEVAQDKSKAGKLLVNASFLSLAFSILMAGVMCLVVNLITDAPDTIHSAYVLSISLIPFTLALVCQSISRGFEKLGHITIAAVIANGLKVLFGSFILFKGYGLVHLMVVISASNGLMLIISLYFALKCVSGDLGGILKIDIAFCRWIIAASPVFALIFVFAAIRQNVDILILTKMMGEREVGFYSAASKLVNIGALGISFYIMAVQPVIFRLFKSSPEKFEMVCVESIRYLLIMMFPIIVLTTFSGDKFVLLIFGKEFLPSAYVLSILIWLLILSGFNQIYTNALVASNHQKVNLIGNIISMIANVCLNLLLIPRFSFIGAGIASVVSALVILIYQHNFISKHLFKVNYFTLAKKPFIATIFTGVVIFLLRDINLVFLIFISVVSYFISLLALKAFSERDIDLVQKLLKGEKQDLGVIKSRYS
jgi:O-antigen/teichoic acid export membrane protein